jgi:hypothetical protein
MPAILKNYWILLAISFFVISCATVFFLEYRNVSSLPEPESIESMVTETYEQCKTGLRDESMSKELCYARALQTVARSRGAEDAFTVLFEIQKMDPDAIGCHFVSHGIGYGAYERDPEQWQQSINTINQACTYGAIHGVIEKYILSLQSGLTREIIPQICGSEPISDCNHIIGHLLLVETNGNIDEALELCTVFEDSAQREFCYTGVFMEQVTAVNLLNHGIVTESWMDWPARVDSLEKLCTMYDSEREVACWQEIVHAVAVKFQNDPEETFVFCSKSRNAEAASKCRYHAIGILAAARNFDLFVMKDMCLLPQRQDQNFQQNCYVQLVASVLSTSYEKASEAIDFCSTLELEPFQHACLQQIGYNLRYASPMNTEQIRQVCLRAPLSMQSLCQGEHTIPSGTLPRQD